ncbi:MAG TPA: 2-oxoglutarate dehydrogenase, E2 component, dihydrolipoamide succinyltransferase [Nocardioidaceae bacterium]|nr:2-oxoglutarate dehydrogenase, E2 component, dihydrolipoamide succinyltransferase [Nocardioidaceae bacterium]
MPVSVTLPALGESVTEGTVTRWLKQPGDTVEVDEPLLEVSTDKVDTEIPSPAAGTLLEVKVSEDETVEVGAELATIGEASEAGEQGGDQGGGEQQEAAEEQEQPQQEQQEAPQEEAAQAQEQPQQEQQEAPQEEPQPSGQGESGGSAGGGETTPVTLPALGESVTEGTVTRWLKQPGDTVQVDEPLLEVSTDKVDTEIPSPVAGVLVEIKVGEDETVEVGAVLATVGAEDSAPQQAAPQQAAPQQEAPQEQAPQEQAAEPEEPEAEPEPEQAATTQEARDTAPGQGDTPQSEREESGAQETKVAESAAAQRQEAPTPAPTPGQAPSQAPSQPPSQPPGKAAARAEGEPSSNGSAYVTPLVRKLAAEHEVDLSNVTGSGVGGRIRKQDVIEAAKSKQAPAEPAAQAAPAAPAQSAPAPVEPSPLRGKTEKMTRLRKVIAARMVESLQTSAQLTTVVEVDVTAIARLRQAKKDEFAQREGVKLSFTPFFAKAVVDSLKGHPKLNAAIDAEKGEITYYDAEHLGMAVDTERGLLVATVKDAGDLSIAGLARKIDDLGRRTRDNNVKPDELSGATFTMTNTGSRGALFDTPIINQPQVGILGTGAVVKRPVVIDDANLGETIAVRHMCYFALTYDHRLVDGADAARFLSEVKQRLEHGQFDV